MKKPAMSCRENPYNSNMTMAPVVPYIIGAMVVGVAVTAAGVYLCGPGFIPSALLLEATRRRVQAFRNRHWPFR